MAKRRFTRLNGPELLEPRLYLSCASARAATLACFEIAVRPTAADSPGDSNSGATQLTPTDSASNAAADDAGVADSIGSILAVDLNGVANDASAAVAVFETASGDLVRFDSIDRGELLVAGSTLIYQTTSPQTGETLLRGFSLGADWTLDTNGNDQLDPTSAYAPSSIGLHVGPGHDTSYVAVIIVQNDIGKSVSFGALTAPRGIADTTARTDGTPPAASGRPNGDEAPVTPPTNIVVPLRDPEPRPVAIDLLTRLFPSPWFERAMRLRTDAAIDSNSGPARPAPSLLESDDALDSAISGTSLIMNSPGRSIAFLKSKSLAGSAGSKSEPGGVLQVYDYATGKLTDTGQFGLAPLVNSNGKIAFLTPESAQGVDLNGDGALADRVLQFFDPATGGVRNTGRAGTTLKLAGGQVLLVAKDGSTVPVANIANARAAAAVRPAEKSPTANAAAAPPPPDGARLTVSRPVAASPRTAPADTADSLSPAAPIADSSATARGNSSNAAGTGNSAPASGSDGNAGGE